MQLKGLSQVCPPPGYSHPSLLATHQYCKFSLSDLREAGGGKTHTGGSHKLRLPGEFS